MTGNNKRKEGPRGGDQQSKKKRTGNAGKWKTPHQQTKALSQESSLQPGDTGIWITCARHQEAKAAREIGALFSEYAEKIYGIKSVHGGVSGQDEGHGKTENNENDDDDDEDDIEAALEKEIAALKPEPKPTVAPGAPPATTDNNQLTPLKMNVDCLLFVKTVSPINPVAFVRRICEDARQSGNPGAGEGENLGMMRCRYVNRLTPVSVMGKASENGLVEVAREVLKAWFRLKGEDHGEEGEAGVKAEDKKPFTFAIRPTIRNHSNLKRDYVIHTIAGLINDDYHKVNLTTPDKVILVDIYQAVCGMSVVDGDWDELKRYNLTELYAQGQKARLTRGDSKKEEDA